MMDNTVLIILSASVFACKLIPGVLTTDNAFGVYYNMFTRNQ